MNPEPALAAQIEQLRRALASPPAVRRVELGLATPQHGLLRRGLDFYLAPEEEFWRSDALLAVRYADQTVYRRSIIASAHELASLEANLHWQTERYLWGPGDIVAYNTPPHIVGWAARPEYDLPGFAISAYEMYCAADISPRFVFRQALLERQLRSLEAKAALPA